MDPQVRGGNEPDKSSGEWKCFEFVCSNFPRCVHATGCCGMDDWFEDRAISAEECFDLADKPLFREKGR